MPCDSSAAASPPSGLASASTAWVDNADNGTGDDIGKWLAARVIAKKKAPLGRSIEQVASTWSRVSIVRWSVPSKASRSSSRRRRPRRTSAEVRSLLIEAARESFRDGGYAQTRTLEIAQRAGVEEKAIFRHFGTKAGLFEVAVVDTFAVFLHAHISAWRTHFDQERHDIRAPVAAYVGGLYDLLVENRNLLRAYLAPADPRSGPQDLLGRALEPLDDLSTRERSVLQGGPIDIVVTTRATFGMLLSLAVYGDLLFSERRPTRDEIVQECTAIVLDGWTHRGKLPLAP
jgi:AcrR family transcriptional regulator